MTIRSFKPKSLQTKTLEPSQTQSPTANRRLWWAAIKPPMYSVAIMPIWVGSAIAYAATGKLDPVIFGLFLGSAVLILAWENLSNDVFDADTGVDVNKRNSLVNMTGNRSMIFWIAHLCLGLGLSGIAAIALLQQSVVVIALVLACCAIGYIYQGPPFRLSYQGLGEPLCFVAFGPLACSASYYSQTQSFSPVNTAAAIVIGLTTSLILFCSHFNQVKDDAAVGKRSPVVRLGAKRSAYLLPWICSSIYGIIALWVALGIFPLWSLLAFASIPIAITLCHTIISQYDQPHQLLFCRLIAVKLHFWSGFLFGLAFLIDRWI
jgi:2-carboxy-1,4-naphthoquinone phytyltransferase